MALNDLTGQNIQDSYKRVLTVGDDGLMYDGTGSLYTPLSASHEITTELSSSHAVSADTASFATNFTASGNISASGHLIGQIGALSPAFGEDGHHPAKPGGDIVLDYLRSYNGGGNNRTGNIRVGVGQIIIHPDNLSSNSLLTQGLQLYGGSFNYSTGNNPSINTHLAGDLELKVANNLVAKIEPTGIDLTGQITASGNISASGNLSATGDLDIDGKSHFAGHITASNDISGSAGGTVSAGSGSFHVLKGDTTAATGLSVAGYIEATNITASGNISASGTISAGFMTLSGNRLRLENDNFDIMDGGLEVNGNVTASGNISASGNLYGVVVATPRIQHIDNSSDIYFATGINVALNNHITASGNISSSGIIYGARIYPNGPAGPYIDNDPGNGNDIGLSTGLFVSTNITASGDISASGTVVAQDFATPGKIYLNSSIIGTGTDYIEYANGGFLYKGNGKFVGNITASGNISASGDLTVNEITASGNILSLSAIQSPHYNSTTSATGYKLTGAKVIHTQASPYSATVFGRDASVVISGSSITLGNIGDVNTHVTASGDISASGNVYSDNIETFWNSFSCNGDSSFASSAYGPNTHGMSFYTWNKNWTSTTGDGGNPTGDHVHRSEINTGWYVPYKIKIVELVGGFHDANAASTVVCKFGLWNTAASLKDADYDSNTGTTKEFIVSASCTLNENRWKHFNETCEVELDEGQYVLPRIIMGEDINNLRGQFTIKYKRIK